MGETGSLSGLGPPCVDDGQCDDGIACTFDACDEGAGRCRSVPDDSECADDSFCNGVEVCTPGLGCRPGEPTSCSDGTACTIDRCDESTRTCEHSPRDADGDGDPDENCDDGSDCDETDPLISSLAPEVCDNERDDDCDGSVDESDCESPEYDSCSDALKITESGSFSLSSAAAASDFAASCASVDGMRDLVAAVVVPEGDPVDVDIVLSTSSGQIALGAAEKCGDPSTETACAPGTRTPGRRTLARLRLRAPDPGAHPVYLFAKGATDLSLHVSYEPPEPKADNETCATARSLELGDNVVASLVDAEADVDSACSTDMGDLVYRITLDEKRDLHVVAASLDDYGLPSLSLRDARCVPKSSEIACRTTDETDLFWRALDPGEYFIRLSATGPTDLTLRATASPPTDPPADESCSGAPPLTPNETLDVSLDDHVDDIRLGCLEGAPDAAFALDLSERSDVLVVERLSEGDEGAVSLVRADCSAEPLFCASGNELLVRAAAHDVEPGDYRVVVESLRQSPTSVTPLVRPAAPPTLVAFADTCEDAVPIGPSGGFFQGNTANASADYEASCDRGGGGAGGGPDQMLALSLSERRRVVLDMRGSSYSTILNVRRGPGCPGEGIVNACTAAVSSDRSFLDLVLDAGTYYVQIDGYGGDEGPWFLDAYVIPP